MNRGVSAARPQKKKEGIKQEKREKKGSKNMGAVMQIADQRESKTQEFPAFVARRAGSAKEGELSPAMRKISQLNAEILMLRSELQRAQRTILQRDILLHNARIREMTWKAGA